MPIHDVGIFGAIGVAALGLVDGDVECSQALQDAGVGVVVGIAVAHRNNRRLRGECFQKILITGRVAAVVSQMQDIHGADLGCEECFNIHRIKWRSATAPRKVARC